LTPGGSSTLHIYTQTMQRIQRKEVWDVRAVPRLCELYPGIALQLRKKHGKPLVRVAQYKNNDTVTRTTNSKCHRTTKNTEHTTEKTVHYR
jgi:hypothetical protein